MLSLSDRIINLVGLIQYRLWKVYKKYEIQFLTLGILLVWLVLSSVIYFPAWGWNFNLIGFVLALLVSSTIVLFFWVFTVSWVERKK